MTEDQASLPPAGGSTSSRLDVRVPDLSGDNLTIEQVADLFGLSYRTVRRHLAAGRLAGAVQRGGRWLIPRAGLHAAYGLPPEQAKAEEPREAAGPVQPGVAELLATLNALLEREAKTQAQLEAGHDRLLEAEVRAARAEEQARAEAERRLEAETRAADLEQRLQESTELRARRRWRRRQSRT